MKVFRIFIICLSSILLTACGFHLRGHAPVPKDLKRIQLVSKTPYDNFNRTLVKTFKSNGVTLSTQAAMKAPYQLVIEQAKHSEKTVSLTRGIGGAHYALQFKVTYRVQKQDSSIVLPLKTIIREKTLATTNLNMGGDAQQQLQLNALMQDAAYQLLMQLRSPEMQKQLNR